MFSKFLLLSTVAAVPKPYMRLIDNLDEPAKEGFCVDLEGWGDTIEWKNVQAHTCKADGSGASAGADEQFIPEGGQVKGYGDGKGRCLQATGSAFASTIDAGTCNTECGLQAFCWHTDGRVKLDDGKFNTCLTAASTMVAGKGGVWQKRKLTLEDCTKTDIKYQAWQMYDAAGTLTSAGSGCSGAGKTNYDVAKCPAVTNPVKADSALRIGTQISFASVLALSMLHI